MKHKQQVYLVIAAFVAGGFLVLVTNPLKMPLPVLIIPFILLFILIWLPLRMVLRYLYPRIIKRKIGIFAGLVAAFPVVCLLLQSIGQLSLRDFITLGALFVVLWFYLNRSITV